MSKKHRDPRKQWRKREAKYRTLVAASRWEHETDQVDRLFDDAKYAEARLRLEDLDRRFPGREFVVANLAFACLKLGDHAAYLDACERLAALKPDNPDHLAALVTAYAMNGRGALSARAARRFAERFPDHDRARALYEVAEEFVPTVLQLVGYPGLTPDASLALAEAHEESLVALERNDFEAVCRITGDLLRRFPGFVSAMNNRAEACFQLGRGDEALSLARQVLELQPENCHALGNLCRYLVALGEIDEARAVAERLRAAPPAQSGALVKKAEALSTLGDDAGVAEVFREYEAGPRPDQPHVDEAMICHLAAAAAARLGREKEAKSLWRRALRSSPGFVLARANLDDMARPVGQRHAPWAFDGNRWLAPQWRKEIEDLARGAKRMSNDEARHGIRRLLERHPAIVRLLPWMFERGSEENRELAKSIALAAKTAGTIAALRDFATGRWGPDAMRHGLLTTLSELGELPPGPTSIWREGKQSEVLLMGFEIHEECLGGHSPEVEALATDAYEALHASDGRSAERLLRKAIELEPNAPDLHNNLAMSLQIQGRRSEARAIIDDVIRRFPDYFFGQIHTAHAHLRARNLDEARRVLTPLLQRKRLHRTEFVALAKAEMLYCLEMNQRQGAERWLDMWKGVDPDNPEIPSWRTRLWYSTLAGLLGGLIRGK